MRKSSSRSQEIKSGERYGLNSTALIRQTWIVAGEGFVLKEQRPQGTVG
jgi:hypothetical protein